MLFTSESLLRLSEKEIPRAFLNKTLSVRGKLKQYSSHSCVLRQSVSCGVSPKRIQTRIKKARVCHSLKIERAFLKDEIERSRLFLDEAKKNAYNDCHFVTVSDFWEPVTTYGLFAFFPSVT